MREGNVEGSHINIAWEQIQLASADWRRSSLKRRLCRWKRYPVQFDENVQAADKQLRASRMFAGDALANIAKLRRALHTRRLIIIR